MLDTALRSRCEQRLSQLPLPFPFTLDRFRLALAVARQRPLTIAGMPASEPGGPSGLWVATEDADYVFVDETASPVHRDHIALHELAHIVCDHHDATGLSAGDAAALLPSLDREMVARVLGRSRYTEAEEREAELLATLIAQCVAERAQHRGDPDVQALRGRLRSALG